MATSHSWVMVPIICASMSPSMFHNGIIQLRRKFGEEVFGGAVSEVRAALAHLSRPVRVTQLGLDPFIDPADQDDVIEKVTPPSLAFKEFEGCAFDEDFHPFVIRVSSV